MQPMLSLIIATAKYAGLNFGLASAFLPGIFFPTPSNTPTRTNMAIIPAGAYISGPTDGVWVAPAGDLKTPKEVVTSCYWIDKYPVPVDISKNPVGQLPKTDISWNEAKSICEARGTRLCTRDEYEKSAKGPENLIYPYGNEYNQTICGETMGMTTLLPIGSFPNCVSGYGVAETNTNINEWTSTLGPTRDADGNILSYETAGYLENCEQGAFLGGADTGHQGVTNSHWSHLHCIDSGRYNDDGVRCCADPTPEEQTQFCDNTTVIPTQIRKYLPTATEAENKFTTTNNIN